MLTLTDTTQRNINIDLEEQGKETSMLGDQPPRRRKLRWANQSFAAPLRSKKDFHWRIQDFSEEGAPNGKQEYERSREARRPCIARLMTSWGSGGGGGAL